MLWQYRVLGHQVYLERGVVYLDKRILICKTPLEKRNLMTVTEAGLEHAMDKLNKRPRKSLGFRMPYEVLNITMTSLTVALQG